MKRAGRQPVVAVIAVMFFMMCCSGTVPEDSEKPGIAAEQAVKRAVPGLSTYEGMRSAGVRDIFIHSPWEPESSLALSLPEHCWGRTLPNTSHDSKEPMQSPWRFNADSSSAWYDNVPGEGVVYRARVEADSMAVNLSATVVNNTDETITDIYTLVCLKPDSHRGAQLREGAMSSFRDTSFSRTWIAVDSRPVRLGRETNYHGDLPPGGWAENEISSRINWGVNVKGGPDHRTETPINWFRGDSPGRIVEEVADPPFITVRDEFHEDRWLAIIWYPSRVLFCNPQNPCFHSDPIVPDCPAHDSVTVRGVVLFHQGTIEGLIERVKNWPAGAVH